MTKRQRFGRYLHGLRKDAGLTLRALGTRAGVSYSKLHDIEHGRAELSMFEFEAVARALVPFDLSRWQDPQRYREVATKRGRRARLKRMVEVMQTSEIQAGA